MYLYFISIVVTTWWITMLVAFCISILTYFLYYNLHTIRVYYKVPMTIIIMFCFYLFKFYNKFMTKISILLMNMLSIIKYIFLNIEQKKLSQDAFQ